jgi:hypothetical protein
MFYGFEMEIFALSFLRDAQGRDKSDAECNEFYFTQYSFNEKGLREFLRL